MSRFLRLCLQCKEHLTSVQEGHEEECGWQDVFGQPCLFLPQRVWHLYTKQEKIRERDKMIAKILGELPDDDAATARRMATCFMRFVQEVADYTLQNMEMTMQVFLKNFDELNLRGNGCVEYIRATYGDNCLRYTVDGAVPRIPILFDTATCGKTMGGKDLQFEAGRLYDLYSIVHTDITSHRLSGDVHGFTIQRHVMLFWWQARTEYAVFKQDQSDFQRLVVDNTIFHELKEEGDPAQVSPIALTSHTFEATRTENTNSQLMRTRILSFGDDATTETTAPECSKYRPTKRRLLFGDDATTETTAPPECSMSRPTKRRRQSQRADQLVQSRQNKTYKLDKETSEYIN